MNCVRPFLEYAKQHPRQLALWMPSRGRGPGPAGPGGTASYDEILTLSAKAQRLCREAGVGPGDSVVLADQVGPTLYASLVAVLASGATVVIVEPWLPISRISAVVDQLGPKMFFTGLIGKVWGSAIPALRRIETWADTRSIPGVAGGELHVEEADPSTAGIMTFTSGTTGRPKGVVRTHGNMAEQARCFSDCLNPDGHTGPDLCIFPNFALPNLVSGRTSVFISGKWRRSDLAELDRLPEHLAPVSISCGPSFLLRLMEVARVPSLRTINILGATSDCWLLEEGFRRWPGAAWQHAYGSSEALPVARMDARESVRESRESGYHQVLCVGRPIPHIAHELEPDGVWVTGGSVCGEYYGNPDANRELKRRDAEGRIWHWMGDRIRADGGGGAGGVGARVDGGEGAQRAEKPPSTPKQEDAGAWWYSGRSGQPLEEFELEQRIFSHRRSSKCFVHRDEEGRLQLCGLGVAREADELRRAFPEIDGVVELREMIYDRRHRARLDRGLSLRRGRSAAGKWFDTAKTWIDWFVR
jgi:acyl-CoA synthetase (AMP-forming)/AMP-acid ligase II